MALAQEQQQQSANTPHVDSLLQQIAGNAARMAAEVANRDVEIIQLQGRIKTLEDTIREVDPSLLEH